jgi:hypothetical protein
MHASNAFLFFNDGGRWCAAPPCFEGGAEVPAGWGITRAEAYFDLISNREFQALALKKGWEIPSFEDFKVISPGEALPWHVEAGGGLPVVASAHRSSW